MLHADLGGVARETVGQRGDEGVDGAAPHNRVDDRAAVGAEHATLIRHLDARGPFAHKIDQLRGVGAEKRILPIEPEAAHVVVPRVDLREQLGDFLRRVLQVGIERHNDLAAHALKRRHDRHVLAVVGVEIDHAGDVGPRVELGAQQFDRTVGAAVVGEEDLVAAADGVEHRVEPREQDREIEFLVVYGDDDRELGRAHGFRWAWRIAARLSTTRATSSRVIAGKSGRERIFRQMRSAIGRSPSFQPRRR